MRDRNAGKNGRKCSNCGHPIISKLMYSRQDAAEASSLSLRSIDYAVRDGRIAPVRIIGGRTLIPVDSLKAFLSQDQPAPLVPVACPGPTRHNGSEDD